MKGKKVVIMDDVISTGSTLQGMRMVLDKAGASRRSAGGDLHRRRPRPVDAYHFAGTFAAVYGVKNQPVARHLCRYSVQGDINVALPI